MNLSSVFLKLSQPIIKKNKFALVKGKYLLGPPFGSFPSHLSLSIYIYISVCVCVSDVYVILISLFKYALACNWNMFIVDIYIYIYIITPLSLSQTHSLTLSKTHSLSVRSAELCQGNPSLCLGEGCPCAPPQS